MSKILFSLIFSLSLFKSALGQDPDTIMLSIKDTVSSYRDCVIKMEISRKDGKAFVFPSNIETGSEWDYDSDILVLIEKKKGNEFVHYGCRLHRHLHQYFIERRPIKYRRYKKVSTTDSLVRLDCLDSGEFRIRVEYNKRKPKESDIGPYPVLISNWSVFRVNSKEIWTDPYLRKRVEDALH